jgi:hypothetical protein
MIDTLAIVTFMLIGGSHATTLVIPPGGEYHDTFGFMCGRNRSLAIKQVEKMIVEKRIQLPEQYERYSVKILCNTSLTV